MMDTEPAMLQAGFYYLGTENTLNNTFQHIAQNLILNRITNATLS